MNNNQIDNSGLHVYKAINAIQAKLAETGISKVRKNQQQGYSFRGIDDVYNALSSVMAEQKLCILPCVLSRDVSERETKSGSVMFYVVVQVRFDFVSSVDGSRHSVVTFGESMDSGDKATNKAMSAAYKYAAMQTFCIPTEGDHDADFTTPPEVAAKKPATITSDQAALLDQLLTDTGTDRAKFLEFYQARDLLEFPVVQFAHAHQKLRAKPIVKIEDRPI